MRLRFHPACLLAVLYGLFVSAVLLLESRLPEAVATHFNAAGNPNGWTSREGWRMASLGMGTVLPLAVIALFWALRFLPARCFNLPHREHWLAADRRPETLAFLARQGWWLACLEVAFIAGMTWSIVAANAVSPPRLANGPALALAVAFLVCLTLWILALVRRFRRIA